RGQRARGPGTPGEAWQSARPGYLPVPSRWSSVVTSAIRGLFGAASLVAGASWRRGPTSRLGGPLGPKRAPARWARLAVLDAATEPRVIRACEPEQPPDRADQLGPPRRTRPRPRGG